MTPGLPSPDAITAYKDFFGLTTSPFELSPDPFFMFSSEKNTEALTSISEAIRQRKGFVVMTGEVGTGKTLMLRCLFETWEREQIPFAYFIGPRLSTFDFLSYITYELGIEVAEPSKGNLLRALYGFLLAQFENGLTTVLVIDEAHQLPRTVLEEIRLVANFETAQQKLVQIVLVGQPELDKKLDSVELRSLKQRITVRCRLEPLRPEEVRAYIERRLELAGAGLQSTTIFPADTVRAIVRYSGGIPRLVNSICDQALIAACAKQVRVVPAEIVEQVAANFRLEATPVSKRLEKPIQTPARIEPAATEKPLAAAAAATASPRKAPNPNSIFVGLGVEEPAPKPADTQNSPRVLSRTGAREEPAPAKRKIFSYKSIFGIVLMVIAVALPTGFIMARRQKSALKLGSQAASLSVTLPAVEAAASVLPASMPSSPPMSSGSIGSALSPANNVLHSSRSLPKQESDARAKLLMGTLRTPTLRPARLPASTEPPAIVGNQTAELDLGKNFSRPSMPTPVVGSMPPSGKMVREPQLLSSATPIYPAMAKQANTEGVVVISAGLDLNGSVASVKVISGPMVLRQAAMDAVKQWKYSPALIDGRPAEAQVTIDITFRLR